VGLVVSLEKIKMQKSKWKMTMQNAEL